MLYIYPKPYLCHKFQKLKDVNYVILKLQAIYVQGVDKTNTLQQVYNTQRLNQSYLPVDNFVNKKLDINTNADRRRRRLVENLF